MKKYKQQQQHINWVGDAWYLPLGLPFFSGGANLSGLSTLATLMVGGVLQHHTLPDFVERVFTAHATWDYLWVSVADLNCVWVYYGFSKTLYLVLYLKYNQGGNYINGRQVCVFFSFFLLFTSLNVVLHLFDLFSCSLTGKHGIRKYFLSLHSLCF